MDLVSALMKGSLSPEIFTFVRASGNPKEMGWAITNRLAGSWRRVTSTAWAGSASLAADHGEDCGGQRTESTSHSSGCCLTITSPGHTQAQGTCQGLATALSFTDLSHLP